MQRVSYKEQEENTKRIFKKRKLKHINNINSNLNTKYNLKKKKKGKKKWQKTLFINGVNTYHK